MNANAAKWVKALESGEYKQGRGRLRGADSYCCLGVACELAVQAGVIPPGRADRTTNGLVEFRYHDYETAVLPAEVRDWLGLKTHTGVFRLAENRPVREAIDAVEEGSAIPDRDFISLTQLNDAGIPFSTIATVIREEPEGLFANQ